MINMTDQIIMEGKGITVELWTNAKGETQYRIKINISEWADINDVPKKIVELTEEIKKGLISKGLIQ